MICGTSSDSFGSSCRALSSKSTAMKAHQGDDYEQRFGKEALNKAVQEGGACLRVQCVVDCMLSHSKRWRAW